MPERASKSGSDDRFAGVDVVHGNPSDQAFVPVNVLSDDRDGATEHQDTREDAGPIAELEAVQGAPVSDSPSQCR